MRLAWVRCRHILRVIRRRWRNHLVRMTTAHPTGEHTAAMFKDVVVAVGEDDSGRDAVALGKELGSAHGRLTLIRVLVVASKPAPDSGAVGYAARRRYACDRLAALAAEFSVGAQPACVEARSVRRGLHGFVSSRRADLLVAGTSPPDESSPVPLRDHTREVLEDAMPGCGGAAGICSSCRRREQDPCGLRPLGRERAGAGPAGHPGVTGLHAEVGSGDGADELARYSDSVELLVVGARKYRPIDHLLDGSTSQRLAGRASSPLLVLPSAR